MKTKEYLRIKESLNNSNVDMSHYTMRDCVNQYNELSKFDNFITKINVIPDIEMYIFNETTFTAVFYLRERFFVIDKNIDNTFTLQENLKNGDIIYIYDNVKYENTFIKNVINYYNKTIKL